MTWWWRFFCKVELTDTCWLWIAYTTRDGYGRFKVDGKAVYAHRWLYEYLIGPVPKGKELDHICRVRHCVNPFHLEPVTHVENTMRGDGFAARASKKTRCVRGHIYDKKNTRYRPNGTRECKECHRQWNRERQ